MATHTSLTRTLLGLAVAIDFEDGADRERFRERFPDPPASLTAGPPQLRLRLERGAGGAQVVLEPGCPLGDLLDVEEFSGRFAAEGPRIVDRSTGIHFGDVGGAVTISEPVLAGLEILLLHFALISARAAGRDPLLLHGAAVAANPEVALVLVGASGAGKSTLTRAFDRIGWSVLSDEVVAIDDGRVLQHPRALSLRNVNVAGAPLYTSALGEEKVLEAPTGAPLAAATLRALAFLGPHGDRLELAPLGPRAAAEQLVAHTYAPRRDRVALFLRHAGLCAALPLLAELRAGPPEATVIALAELIQGHDA